MIKQEVNVTLTGAAGQIGYALLFRIASGQMFGPQTLVHLRLLELDSAMGGLAGVKMELDDCAFSLLGSIIITSDTDTAFKGADWALLIGSFPRKAGMERSDLLKINGGIFTKQGRAINEHASPKCRVLVVGNPCNTNAFIAKASAPDIPAKNFFAMTMLDQHRAFSQLAEKAGVHCSCVKNVTIWGNHSATQYPNFYNGSINGKPVTEIITDEKWLREDFIGIVQKRGAAVIGARGSSSAASAANAVIDTVVKLTTPTPDNEWFSVAVPSDGSHDIPEGLFFSFPVCSDGENWRIVKDMEINDFSREKIALTMEELIAEREAVRDIHV